MNTVTMMDYIRETPQIGLHNIENSREITKALCDFYLQKEYEGICIIACGSSFNGAALARYYIQKVLKCPVHMVTPFTFLNHDHDQFDKWCTLCISQSGCSTNILDCVAMLNENNQPNCGIVGRDDCDLKKLATLTVNWMCGEEKIGFVTKGVVLLGLYLMLFANEAALAKGVISESEYCNNISDLKKAISLHPEVVEKALSMYRSHSHELIDSKAMVFLSSGANMGTAMEGALKVSETSCLSAMAVEAEEFLHGPLYPCNDQTAFFIIDNNHDDCSSARILSIADALQTVSEKIYTVSDTYVLNNGREIVIANGSSPLTSPLYKLAALQVFAFCRTEDTNRYRPHENILKFKALNKVASKSRSSLYLDLQNGAK